VVETALDCREAAAAAQEDAAVWSSLSAAIVHLFGHLGTGSTAMAAVEALGGAADLRQSPSGESFVTDDGLWILDARFATGIDNPAALDAALAAIAGVAACGVFAGMAERAFVGDREGAWLYRRLID